ncbi:Phage tail assembly chaperone protein [uncultured Caudovirales phage]|uniref:Phage tail assembly chaperone protein n=1 Tax=uncultured Caudovirales phage TaxID=2100421 RepID=A0A6J7X5R5_9CAUD|nr:Phage tail assembly chaperone protein [uncultured Caudovirales phage]
MKRYCHIKNKQIVIGPTLLPINWENVSNFNLLTDIELKQYGWFPVITITDGKEIIVKSEFVIHDTEVQEIVTTRDKTQVEKDMEDNQTLDIAWYDLRSQRDSLLLQSDISILPDKWEEMNESTKQAWRDYRKQLRDLTNTVKDPRNPIFPIKPLG